MKWSGQLKNTSGVNSDALALHNTELLPSIVLNLPCLLSLFYSNHVLSNVRSFSTVHSKTAHT